MAGFSNPDEQRHFTRVCNSLAQHSSIQLSLVNNYAARIANLSPAQQLLLPSRLKPNTAELKSRMENVANAGARNQNFLDHILMHANQPSSQDHYHYRQQLGDKYVWESAEDCDKVGSVLKSAVRDWSEEGRGEREQCYKPVIDGLNKHGVAGGKVFVGGAGLGRLALELIGEGFAVQGNDVSYHMLLASDYILNCLGGDTSFHISPYVNATTNQVSLEDSVRSTVIPDIDPQSLLTKSGKQPDFSMAAGEFVECYSKEEEKGQWDGIASCFFLDTAGFVGDYVKCIWEMLKPGGVLVNLGPLLWHWTSTVGGRPDEATYGRRNVDVRYTGSVDMTWEDLREVLVLVGFEIVEEKIGLKCEYTRDNRAMMHTQYSCVYFVARKPITK